ncbi:MAG TPA: GMC family oxidoreductase [Chlamydiales bacterium]|nr:GMC family oxidoreductase [Chlamydiales bacterium]HPE85270.1 GMC family oxidoreductase [Chlamydiales bacterium]
MEKFDIIIIGSGAGGGTLAHKLAPTGKKILIIERGDFLPREKENWDPQSVFVDGHYNPDEKWLDKDDKPFTPGTHYYVGGNTKFYGAALLRLRESDFDEVKHYGGISPAWPLKYADFKPYYLEAERLYSVHGLRGNDPTEPKESEPYPCDPISHEPCVQRVVDRLQKANVGVFHLPVGVRLNEKNREKSQCIRCSTCDGFPCMVDAKADAHTTCIRPALEHDNVTLLTKTKAEKLIEENGKIVAVEVITDGKAQRLTADIFVLSCGAINSSALLLKSGVANSSGLVGRNYMCHNNSAIVALSKERNTTHFQKTLGINDYYYGGPDSHLPLGHIQLLGTVMPAMLAGDAPALTPEIALKEMADHAMGWWITSEDLPDPENRVTVTSKGQIQLHYTENNLEAHKRLYDKLKEIIHISGPTTHIFTNSMYLRKKIPLAGVAHQVGTCKFGTDPKTSVLDTQCRAHDLDNLYVVDGSFFPSVSGVNPGLTIIANALRVGDILAK